MWVYLSAWYSWGESFEFKSTTIPVCPVVVPVHMLLACISAQKTVDIALYDYDRVSADDFLGMSPPLFEWLGCV